MAEFCKECIVKILNVNLKKQKVILSNDWDLCEGCGEIKPVAVKIVYKNPIRQFVKKKWGY